MPRLPKKTNTAQGGETVTQQFHTLSICGFDSRLCAYLFQPIYIMEIKANLKKEGTGADEKWFLCVTVNGTKTIEREELTPEQAEKLANDLQQAIIDFMGRKHFPIADSEEGE